MSQPYLEETAIQPAMFYKLYTTYSKEKTGDITPFIHFEEGNLLSEPHYVTESGEKSDYGSTLPPLISEAEMAEMSSGD